MNSIVDSLIAKIDGATFPVQIAGYVANRVEARLNKAGDKVQVIVSGEVDTGANPKPVRSTWEMVVAGITAENIDGFVSSSFDMMAKRIAVDIKAFQVVA